MARGLFDDVISLMELGALIAIAIVLFRIFTADTDTSNVNGDGPVNWLNKFTGGRISAGDTSVESNLQGWWNELIGTDEQRADAEDDDPGVLVTGGPGTPEQAAAVQQAIANYDQDMQDPANAITNWALDNRLF